MRTSSGRPSLRRRLALGAASAALAACAAVSARAQGTSVQLSINSAFVHQVNANCVVQTINGVPRFLCPPIPASVCSGIGGCPGGGCAIPACRNPGQPSTNPDFGVGASTGFGNISNDPHLEFDQASGASGCAPASLPQGDENTNVCNSEVFLCASIGYGNAGNAVAIGIDMLEFEIFKYQDGSNPLDPGSTPPLRTFFIDQPGVIPANCTSDTCGPLGPFCVLWDGSYPIQGEFGKTNGQYGFRITAQTNQTGGSGNIQITAVRAYPSGATHDADFVTCPTVGCVVPQKPLSVDVTNVHVVRSSPTLVGAITAVAAEPYNIIYRLSKDANMYINITDSQQNRVRTLLTGLPRVGEGTPNGTLTNGDGWNGREDNGDLAPPGVYLANLQASARDLYGTDLSATTTRQVSLDPLQITDIAVSPLLEGPTSLAVISYQLTEPATTFVDIYPPGTQFCNFAADVNTITDQAPPLPPKDFQPRQGACGGAAITPLRRLVDVKTSRSNVLSFWDGRDDFGNLLADGDYVFVIYAALPSQNGVSFLGQASDKRIWTTQAKSGFLSILRGLVGISQITPSSTVIGSSPAVAGLNPFVFRYSLSRDALVGVKIFNQSGTTLVKTLVSNAMRPGLFPNVETWSDGTDDAGRDIDAGSYLVQLTATDPSFPTKVSTTTAQFSANPYRITDVQSTPLLTGASDLVQISYQLSQSMNVALNIYAPGTVVNGSSGTWPPCGTLAAGGCGQVLTAGGQPADPIINIHGLRAGRLRITEQWDGRDIGGLMVPDGTYVFTLVAQTSSTPQHFAAYDASAVGRITVQRGSILFPSFSVTPDVPTLFNSSATITLHPFTVGYSVTRQSSVTIQILNTNLPPSVVRTLVSGGLRENNVFLQDIWDGRDDRGNFVPSGFYTVRAVATDIASQLSSPSTAQVTISVDPLRIYDVAVTPLRSDNRQASIFYQLSEPMKVSIKVFKPGTVFDGAGNPTPPESVSLVKRIIGTRPARVQIEDIWDGTDLTLSMVPDGTYRFKVVASTDPKAIDDITGNVNNFQALSLDRPIDDVPVVRNTSIDPQGDFERNTYAYPNPVNGPNATFSIFSPFQGKVTLKIFNVAGELVLDKDFGELPPSFSGGAFTYVWAKANQSGRSVARGLYFAVVRVDETLGGKNVLQTVKKVLIP